MRIDKTPRLLARAAMQAGGTAALAAELHLSERVLGHYLKGNEPIPDRVVLQVAEIVLQRLREPVAS